MPTPHRIDRRRLLQSSRLIAGGALAAGGFFPAHALAAGLPHAPQAAFPELRAQATPAAQNAAAPVALSAQEFATLRAVVSRLIPTDDLGTGAGDAGVHLFIDRGLAGPLAASLPRYQATLRALNAAAPTRDFAAATPEQQDELIGRLEAGRLDGAPEGAFAQVLEHTREGMFGDPVYGGNRDFAGWDLIGYPGIKLLWTQADQEINATVAPAHLSVAQFGGKGW